MPNSKHFSVIESTDRKGLCRIKNKKIYGAIIYETERPQTNKTTQKCRQTAFNIEHSLALSGELPMASCEKHQHYLTQAN
jgi:hypothetical protein